MAYVEVKAKTVEMAIEAAMRELGVAERDRLDIEVLQEPERGFFGFGGQDAIVKVSERSGGKRSRSRNRSRSKATQTKSESPASQPAPNPKNPDRQRQSGGGNRPGNGRSRSASSSGSDKVKAKVDDRDALGTEGQEPLVRGFLEGLLESFGLEGSVETRIDEDVIVANVVGDQTEALVGPRGSVMEAVHELTKTVLQRTAQDPARVRIDIAGYAERRRQALTIYAGDLIKQVQGEGGELMLEPMSASDRKVIHDAVAAHDGVRSYSEGEAPGRYVVIAAAEEGSAAEES